ncbi:hypothetical protein BST43_20610 [Mycobacteroides saopaulense]|uniref:Uncharacterized protein n=1 Tax=Mycobacteroides saopaulense TaxID=1578165 RepID=A0A1X0IS59_9MYCO|nr:hypothetical protein BST43_20610 [Mycobacteroides saopaulense]
MSWLLVSSPGFPQAHRLNAPVNTLLEGASQTFTRGGDEGPLALVRSVLLGRLLGVLAVTMRHPPDTVDQRISCPDATSNQNDMSGTPVHANSGG